MKITNKFITPLCISLMSLGFYSCESVGNTNIPEKNSEKLDVSEKLELSAFEGSTDPEIEIIDSARISWKEHYEFMMKASLEDDDDQTRSAENELHSFAQQQLNSIDSLTKVYQDSITKSPGEARAQYLRAGTNVPLLGYKYISMQYKSVDRNGKPVTLSQLVAYPYNLIFKNPAPKNIVIGCHVTITSDAEAPSKYKNMLSDVGMIISHAKKVGNGNTSDNLVVIPDYEGYGVSSSKAHPYLYRDLTARQVVDGVIAAKKWYEDNEGHLDPKWQSFSVGYSQGGAVAMAVHRYIEKNKLTNKLRFAGSIAGDGPYDLEETMRWYVRESKVYMPAAMALIVKGLCETNPYLAGKYRPSDFFTDEFMKSGIIQMIESKQYSTKDIQKKMLEYSWNNNNGFYMMAYAPVQNKFLKYTKESSGVVIWNAKKNASSYVPLELVAKPELIEFVKTGKTSPEHQAKMTALFNAMKMNKVVDDWTPKRPLIVFHSKQDEVVPFVNYESASNFLPKRLFRGKIYNTSTYSHVGSGITFYLKYEPEYVNTILSGKWLREPSVSNIEGGIL